MKNRLWKIFIGISGLYLLSSFILPFRGYTTGEITNVLLLSIAFSLIGLVLKIDLKDHQK